MQGKKTRKWWWEEARRKEEEEEQGEGEGRRRKSRRQKIHKTKAVVDDSKSCEYKLIMLLLHMNLTHSVGHIQRNLCRCKKFTFKDTVVMDAYILLIICISEMHKSMLVWLTDSLQNLDLTLCYVWLHVEFYKQWKTCHSHKQINRGMYRTKPGQSRVFNSVIANVWIWGYLCRKNTTCDKAVILKLASDDCTVGKQKYVLSKETLKRMWNCNRGGVEGVLKQGTKNTFFWENSCLGLQSYTDTSQEEWCRAGEERRKENKEEK